jgi:hypothetical protein
MDSQEKMIIKKSEAQLIVDALEFAANNVEFKNAHFVTSDKIAFITKRIKNQFNRKPKILARQGINEITSGWK